MGVPNTAWNTLRVKVMGYLFEIQVERYFLCFYVLNHGAEMHLPLSVGG